MGEVIVATSLVLPSTASDEAKGRERMAGGGWGWWWLVGAGSGGGGAESLVSGLLRVNSHSAVQGWEGGIRC